MRRETSLMRRRAFLSVVALLVAGLGAGEPAQANTNAAEFIRSMATRAISVLKDTAGGDKQKREAEFRGIFRDNFDIAAIGQFVLGIHWRNATEAQRAEFLKEFENYVVRTYAERLSEYSGEQLEVGRAQEQGEKQYVDSVIRRPNGAPPIRIVWEVEKRGGRFKVVDLKIENVSMSQTQRSDFGSYVSQNGGKVDVLIARLKQFNGR
jgi:phospholipid transport system substrate-binding protein